MLIERTDTEIIIRVPSSVNIDGIQELVDKLRYKELTSKIKVPQKTIDKLAKQAKKNWWKKNGANLMK